MSSIARRRTSRGADRRERTAGASLIEVLIASTLAAVAIGGALSFAGENFRSTETLKSLSQLNTRAHRAMETMFANLLEAGVNSLPSGPLPPSEVSRMPFRRPVGFNGGSVQWGPEHLIELERDPSDPDDGVDNNGNGLVDECRIVLRIRPGQPDEVVTVLATRVAEFMRGELPNGLDDNDNGLIDEPGLVFERDDNTIVINLTMQQRGPQGRVFTRMVNSSFVLRN